MPGATVCRSGCGWQAARSSSSPGSCRRALRSAGLESAIESLEPTTQNSYCTVEKGRWFSYYNALYYTNAYGGTVQIDHTVPVGNVWISGAWRWTHATRVRYYNDLGDSRTLVAVDASDNESKGDQDPTAWLPTHGRCRYLRSWVAVKTRWHLHVTAAEKTQLTRLAASCPNSRLTITKAAIGYK